MPSLLPTTTFTVGLGTRMEDGRAREGGSKGEKGREGGLFSPSRGTGFGGEVKFRDNQKRKGRVVEEFSEICCLEGTTGFYLT